MTPETWMLVFTIISFLVVVAILGKFGWPKILKALEDREKAIREAIEVVESSKKTSEAFKAEYEKQVQEVHDKVKEIIAHAQFQGAQTRESILKEAEAEAHKLLEKNRQQLQIEKERLVQELRKEVGELSVMVAEKLMRQTIDKKVQEKFIQDFLKNLDLPPGKTH